jgi:hypothetical protein
MAEPDLALRELGFPLMAFSQSHAGTPTVLVDENLQRQTLALLGASLCQAHAGAVTVLVDQFYTFSFERALQSIDSPLLQFFAALESRNGIN